MTEPATGDLERCSVENTEPSFTDAVPHQGVTNMGDDEDEYR